MSALRTDIQALRGYAVLVVLLYHAQIGPFGAGFLGVDIFFVISGFLITTLIARSLERGDFSLADFYARRAKRLLPAAYITIVATGLAAPWFLDQQGIADLAWQIVGAITFTANFVFWQQTDYFAGNSDLKPLLHTWSLSVEEQYYLMLPGLLMLLPRVRWLRAVLVVMVLSLMLCLAGAAFKPVLTFYLLPTRAWELLMGSAGALWLMRAGTQPPRLLSALCLPAVMLVIALPAVRVSGPHPGWVALLVCVATLVVILGQAPMLNRSSLSRWLAWWGDRSYSLYLVHWPIFALLRNGWVGSEDDLPLPIRLGALVLSVVLAWLLHRFVEEPARRYSWQPTRASLVSVFAVSICVMMIVPLAQKLAAPASDYRALRAANFGFSRDCDLEKQLFRPMPECRNGEHPRVLVWGDSYAMHLVPGLAAGGAAMPILQATRTGCGPMLDIAFRSRSNRAGGLAYDLNWAQNCILFNDAVLDHVAAQPDLHTVVMSSRLTAYVGGADLDHVSRDGGVIGPANVERAADAMFETAARLRALGKKVVFIAPPPAAGFDIGACTERQHSRRLILGAPEDCLIDVMEYRRRRIAVLDLLDRMERGGIPVLRFDEYLCGPTHCASAMDGTLLYRDSGHLSRAGSVLLARRMDLLVRATNAAR
jgi:peptidoglycan/LPS O-acetylase OafA/YrhL